MSTTTYSRPLLDDDGRLSPMFGFLCFHQALRRDAERFGRVTDPSAGVALSPAAVSALQAHWRRYRALLTYHHTIEDERLFELARRQDPSLGELIDELTDQHHSLDGLLERIDLAVDALGDRAMDGDTHARFVELEDLLDPHLSAEEEHVLPVMLSLMAAGGGPPGGGPHEPDSGPVPDSFALVWLTEHLDDETIRLAAETLVESQRVAHPGWAADYRSELAAWWPPATSA